MTSEYIETANRNWAKISSVIGAVLASVATLEAAHSTKNFWEILLDQPTTIIGAVAVAAISAWRTGKPQGEPGAVSKAIDKRVAKAVENAPTLEDV